MDKEVLENHRRYLERKDFYKSFGCDIDEERRFVLDKAQPVFGDILEVGTGKGHFALILAKEGYRFTSVDISEEEQRLARLNLRFFGLDKQVDFRLENAERLSFADRSFDLVFAINTLHHLENAYAVIDQFIRIVSFEGKIILSDFTKTGLELMDKIHKSEGRAHEVSKITLDDAERYLRAKGFLTRKEESRYQEVLVAYHQII
ncbi:MAG: class I SAM-dependent methyltransferase [Candidatus Omnitrophota bacterium]